VFAALTQRCYARVLLDHRDFHESGSAFQLGQRPVAQSYPRFACIVICRYIEQWDVISAVNPTFSLESECATTYL
jgi:hypothetical protein